MAFDPQRPIDAVFARFGVDITVDPDGAAATVRALVDGATGEQTLRGRGIFADRGAVNVRIADLPTLPAGAELEVFGERRVVQGEPEFEDRRRLVATLSTAEKR